MTESPPIDAPTLLAHRNALRALARGLVADEHLAEDAVQQAWVTALEEPPRSVEALSAWLRSVVRNFARKSAQREAERPARERRAARSEAQETDAAREFELQHHVAAALKALPEPYRSAIHQRYYLDLGPREIAAREGVPLDTVKTRLRRGLELLRKDLDARYGGNRRAWSLAAAPLLQPGWAAASALPLHGILSMKVIGIVAASLTAVAAVVFVARPRQSASEPSGEVAAVERAEAELADPGEVVAPPKEGVSEARVAVEPAPAAAIPTAPVEERAVGLVSVVDEHGEPVEGARVGFAARPSFPTDGEGAVELDLPDFDPADAERTLELAAEGYMTLRRNVLLEAGPEVDLGTFVLVRGGSVRGSVLDPDGNPVPGASVIVVEPRQAIWSGVETLASSKTTAQVAHTDARGDFAFDALPAGVVRLWAGAPGLRDNSSEPLVIAAGRVEDGVVIRLEPAPTELEIAGRVRMPAGVPVDGVNVWYSYAADEGRRTRTARIDELGRFRIQLEQSVPHDLWAHGGPSEWDGDRQVFTGADVIAGWRGVVATGVPPGTADLVLEFEEAPAVDVIVTDAESRSLDAFTLGVVEGSGNDLRQEVPWFREVEAPVRLSIPTSEFVVSIFAEGYSRVDLGLYTADTVPDPIRVELERLPLVTGRVTADDKPLTGARVEVFRSKKLMQSVVSAGFPRRMSVARSATSTSSDAGTFALTVRRKGNYFVRASADGWASAEIGPLAIDPKEGLDDLELELTEGGSIEGRVLLPPGTSPAGWVIGATNGDPELKTYTTGPDGFFRFDRLGAGEWLVQRSAATDRSTSTSSSGVPVVWAGNCTVVEGEVTEFDLDFRSAESVVLKGRVDIDGRQYAGWEASLSERTEEEPYGGDDVDHTKLAADGTFELVAPAPGPYVLMVKPENIGPDAVMIVRMLELSEPVHEWSDRLEFGSVTGAIDQAALPPRSMLVWLVQEPDGLTGVPIKLAEDGSLDASVPTGPGRLHYGDPEGDTPPPAWPTLGTADVEAGEAAELQSDF